jgi:uncharacterized protein
MGLFSVRGTGASGGCFNAWGPTEQQDQAALVEWAAMQPWSNGRVTMTGLSYSGATPWEAAVNAPTGLKAITVGGIITDVYLGISSPQGAIRAGADEFEIGTGAAESPLPPGVEDPTMLADYAPVAKDRLSPGTIDVFTAYTLAARADARPQQYFDDRRVADRFSGVTAAILVAQGLQDNDFHAFQEDAIWSKLPNAPKWFVLGQWGHTLRISDQLGEFPYAKSWLDLQLAWYDFWLKGLGDPPRMGVDYQDTSMSWHESTSWPPVEAHDEVLHLAGDQLATAAGGEERSFSAVQDPVSSTYCPGDLSSSPTTPSAAYTSPPPSRLR